MTASPQINDEINKLFINRFNYDHKWIGDNVIGKNPQCDYSVIFFIHLGICLAGYNGGEKDIYKTVNLAQPYIRSVIEKGKEGLKNISRPCKKLANSSVRYIQQIQALYRKGIEVPHMTSMELVTFQHRMIVELYHHNFQTYEDMNRDIYKVVSTFKS